ncbi:3-phosphoshikimate 1-carboxyvinyltransferase [Flavobacterium sp.]|uniref:3-phosphoshikimate 1-carboxyvinyltransferase n=1 Tax=Flavobacterium sp. TaxID=239 RepID=UPI003D6AE178
MNLLLHSSIINQQSSIGISGSKSETNRLLLLQALYSDIVLDNVSNSDDSEVMIKALSQKEGIVDIHHAGTAMRFLTAYFSMKEGSEVVLTGSTRMKERPIRILVDALKQIGADIQYEGNEGFPPLRIKGKKLVENKIKLPANVSSQYVSALLLIASKLENGLEMTLEGEITSIPYINMTLALLNEIGIETSFSGNEILVSPKRTALTLKRITVESDWSSASYFYSIVALAATGTEITLSSYKQNSLQGDSNLTEIYKDFGVVTEFNANSIVLRNTGNRRLSSISCELNKTPDIAQTIAVTCFGLGMGCHLTGLHTLKIKETDRLEALKTELTKLGAKLAVTDDSLTLEPSAEIKGNSAVSTYQDHRMAMAFAPLALKTDIVIEEAEVVSKSYPDFWNDLKRIGFLISDM